MTASFYKSIFIEDQIPKRPERSQQQGRQTLICTFWDVVFYENTSITDCFKQ